MISRNCNSCQKSFKESNKAKYCDFCGWCVVSIGQHNFLPITLPLGPGPQGAPPHFHVYMKHRKQKRPVLADWVRVRL